MSESERNNIIQTTIFIVVLIACILWMAFNRVDTDAQARAAAGEADRIEQECINALERERAYERSY